MPTVVFDFDSTIIDHESLDELIARLLPDDPRAAAEVRATTAAGMEGRIPFRESVERRLAVCAPTRTQVEEYAATLPGRIVPGMAELVAALDADVWLVSGGIEEMLRPTARALAIPDAQVAGTVVRWDAAGRFAGLVRCGPKEEVLAPLAPGWDRPRVMVGDGASDHAVFAAGLVDRFVAFTAVVRREAVVATGAPEAQSVGDLRYLLERWL